MRLQLALPLVVLLVGCAAKHSIVGTWTGTTAGMDFTQKFNSDGTFESSALDKRFKEPVTFTLSGTYEFDGEHLTTTPTAAKVTGLQSKSNAAFEDEIKKNGMKPTKGVVKFTGDDRVTLSGPNSTIDLKREK